eukprot:scaffold4011_cov197-Ochromonas_danica.AAC.5
MSTMHVRCKVLAEGLVKMDMDTPTLYGDDELSSLEKPSHWILIDECSVLSVNLRRMCSQQSTPSAPAQFKLSLRSFSSCLPVQAVDQVIDPVVDHFLDPKY